MPIVLQRIVKGNLCTFIKFGMHFYIRRKKVHKSCTFMHFYKLPSNFVYCLPAFAQPSHRDVAANNLQIFLVQAHFSLVEKYQQAMTLQSSTVVFPNFFFLPFLIDLVNVEHKHRLPASHTSGTEKYRVPIARTSIY